MTKREIAIKSLPDVKKWLLCPRCDTGSVVYLSKTDEFRCKRCGGVFTADFVRRITTITR